MQTHPFLARLGTLRGVRAFATAVLLGVVSAFALPPIYAIPVLFVCVPGLLAMMAGQKRMRGAFAAGFWFGFGHHVVGLYWITEAILFEAARFWWLVPIAVPLARVLAIFIAVPCALAWRAAPGLARALTLAGAWTLADIARQFVVTGFPWNPWGSVWEVPGAFGDVMIQPAALIGVHGLTFLTILVTTTPALGRRAMAWGACCLAAWAGFGFWRLNTPPPATPDLTAVLIQGNAAQGTKQDRAYAIEIFERYLRLTREGVAALHGRPGVVIWPETASPFWLDRDPDARAAVAEAAQGVPVLAGSIRFNAQNRPLNSLMAIVNAGPPVAIYDKSHLVPWGEYQPSWTPLPIQVIPGGGFAAGSGPETLHVPGLPPVGALICYEAIFPAQIVDEANRPDWLVNVTNDAWFGNSTGPRQHLAAVRMRTVEEGLPLMRAANTGITAAFDAFGREQGRIGMNIAGTLAEPLTGALPPTPFSRYGLLLPGILGVSSLGAGLLRRRSAPPSGVPVVR